MKWTALCSLKLMRKPTWAIISCVPQAAVLNFCKDFARRSQLERGGYDPLTKTFISMKGLKKKVKVSIMSSFCPWNIYLHLTRTGAK